MTAFDDRSISEILAADILTAETQAKEIRASAKRLVSDERVRQIASPRLLMRAVPNFDRFAYQCDLAARKMRELADQLGIEPPGPSGFVE